MNCTECNKKIDSAPNIFKSKESQTIKEANVVLYTNLLTWDHKKSPEKHPLDINCVVAVSRDGTMIASGSEQNEINVWRNTVGIPKQVCVFKEDECSIQGISFSPDNKTLASILENTISMKQTIKLWDLTTETFTTSREIPLPKIFVGNEEFKINYNTHIEFSRDGQNLMILGNSRVYFYNIHTIEETEWVLTKFPTNTDDDLGILFVSCITYGWDGTFFATGGYVMEDDKKKGFVKLFHMSDQQINFTFKIIDESFSVSAIAISRDNNYIAWGDSNGKIGLLKINDEEKAMDLIWKSKRSESRIKSVAFSYDSKILAYTGQGTDTINNDPIIEIWDVETLGNNNLLNMNVERKPKARLFSEQIQYNSIAFLPNNTLVSGGSHNSVRIWMCVSHDLLALALQMIRHFKKISNDPKKSNLDEQKITLLKFPVEIQRSLFNFWSLISNSCDW